MPGSLLGEEEEKIEQMRQTEAPQEPQFDEPLFLDKITGFHLGEASAMP